MEAEVSAGAPGSGNFSRRMLIVIGAGIVILFFLLDDVVGWLQGGGIFSVASAIRAADHRTPVVDVDGAGLRILFVAACAILTTCAGLYFKLDLKRRLQQSILALAIMGGGFILDAMYGQAIIAHFMSAQGYSRCAMRDHEVGHAKGRIWFDDYVLSSADCPAVRLDR